MRGSGSDLVNKTVFVKASFVEIEVGDYGKVEENKYLYIFKSWVSL